MLRFSTFGRPENRMEDGRWKMGDGRTENREQMKRVKVIEEEQKYVNKTMRTKLLANTIYSSFKSTW